jgi:hypothetical protein
VKKVLQFVRLVINIRVKERVYSIFALGGVVVIVLATGPKVAGSNPAEDDGF